MPSASPGPRSIGDAHRDRVRDRRDLCRATFAEPDSRPLHADVARLRRERADPRRVHVSRRRWSPGLTGPASRPAPRPSSCSSTTPTAATGSTGRCSTIDPSSPGLSTGIAPGADPPQQGTNDFGKVGYGGPCPPSGTHHYHFTLYALPAPLGLQGHPNGKAVRAALAKASPIAKVTLIGTVAH